MGLPRQQTPAQIPARFADIVQAIRGLDNCWGNVHSPTSSLTPPGSSFLAPPVTAASIWGEAGLSLSTVPAQARLPPWHSNDKRLKTIDAFRSGGANGTNAFGPQDVYTFYDENPLLANGIDGGGGGGADCIAIVGRSDFNIGPINTFNTTFGLPPITPTRVPVDGSGQTINGDENEKLLDIEWAHAIAPGAPISVYIVSEPNANLTNDDCTGYKTPAPCCLAPRTGSCPNFNNPTEDGIIQAIGDNTCGTISVSYQSCYTPLMTAEDIDFVYSNAHENSQSVFVSSGDYGTEGMMPGPNSCVPSIYPGSTSLRQIRM